VVRKARNQKSKLMESGKINVGRTFENFMKVFMNIFMK